MSLFATLVHMAAPAPAGAAGLDGGSIIHVKESNVWLISPDGVQRAQVTTDGTTPSPDGKGSSRYSHPSQSDDGQVVVAVRNQQEQVIAQRGYLWVMNRRGGVVAKFAPPQFEVVIDPVCGGFARNPRGILKAAVSPDGKRIVYEAFTDVRRSDCSFRTDSFVGVVNIDGTGATTIRRAFDGGTLGVGNPSWITSSQLLVRSGSPVTGVHYVDLPDPRSHLWGTSGGLNEPDFEADKLVTIGLFGNQLELWPAAGPPPAPAPTLRCALSATAGGSGSVFGSPNWSPGAGGLTWAEFAGITIGDAPGEGVWVSPIGDLGATLPCPTKANARLLVAGGAEPFWGPTPVSMVAVPGSRFTALPPSRILDTRTGNGAPAATVGPKGVVDLQVTGRGGVPAEADTVVLNITAVGLTGAPASYLTAWPTGETQPLASNLNYVTGEVIPNLVTVKVGAGGKVSLFNALGSVHVLADVTGYYATGAESAFNAVQPERLLDTRTGNGAPALPVGPNGVVEVQVTGRGGVPAGATGVVLNVTAVGLSGSPSSWITAWPTGTSAPLASNLNLVSGQIIPNLVVAKLGTGGKVSLRNQAGNVHLLADVAGYYGPTGAMFTPVAPSRLLDTRTGNGAPQVRLPAGATVELQITGRGGVAPDATAVALNVTAVAMTGAQSSWLTVWPTGQPAPLASNLNMVAGQVIPNSVVAKIGANGKVSISNAAGSVDVLADVAGYYTG